MLNFLEDMKALNVQNRVFALIENGSWAIRSGDLIHRFLDEEMKTITVLNERVTVASHLGENQEEDLGLLADAVADSLRG
jgi:flavorubredoxin